MDKKKDAGRGRPAKKASGAPSKRVVADIDEELAEKVIAKHATSYGEFAWQPHLRALITADALGLVDWEGFPTN